jgi:hypothetical protein
MPIHFQFRGLIRFDGRNVTGAKLWRKYVALAPVRHFSRKGAAPTTKQPQRAGALLSLIVTVIAA